MQGASAPQPTCSHQNVFLPKLFFFLRQEELLHGQEGGPNCDHHLQPHLDKSLWFRWPPLSGASGEGSWKGPLKNILWKRLFFRVHKSEKDFQNILSKLTVSLLEWSSKEVLQMSMILSFPAVIIGRPTTDSFLEPPLDIFWWSNLRKYFFFCLFQI